MRRHSGGGDVVHADATYTLPVPKSYGSFKGTLGNSQLVYQNAHSVVIIQLNGISYEQRYVVY